MGQTWVVKLVSVVQPIQQNPRLELDGTKIQALSKYDPRCTRPDGSLKLRWQ